MQLSSCCKTVNPGRVYFSGVLTGPRLPPFLTSYVHNGKARPKWLLPAGRLEAELQACPSAAWM